MAAVEARQGLNSLDVVKHLVYIHRVQQRLVKARLEHIGHNQNTIGVFLEFGGNIGVRESVHARGGQRRVAALDDYSSTCH